MRKKDFWFAVGDTLGWLSDTLDTLAVKCALLAYRASDRAFHAPPKGWRHGTGR